MGSPCGHKLSPWTPSVLPLDFLGFPWDSFCTLIDSVCTLSGFPLDSCPASILVYSLWIPIRSICWPSELLLDALRITLGLLGRFGTPQGSLWIPVGLCSGSHGLPRDLVACTENAHREKLTRNLAFLRLARRVVYFNLFRQVRFIGCFSPRVFAVDSTVLPLESKFGFQFGLVCLASPGPALAGRWAEGQEKQQQKLPENQSQRTVASSEHVWALTCLNQ